jgi:murein DD-endopeptidase MepM/ murein hydrolase activator NlpD
MYKKLFRTALFCLLLAGVFFHIGGCDNSNGSGGGSNIQAGADTFTPLIIEFLTEPVPFAGSDGKVHLVYEIQISNAVALPFQVNSLEVLNAADQSQLFAEFSGEDVMSALQKIPGRIPTNLIDGGTNAIFFITFSVDSMNDVPEKLIHRLTMTVPGGIPEQFLAFLDLPLDSQEITQTYGELNVSPREAILISPPLKGGRWVAADGCCTAERHVRAVMPINGKQVISQRFAIDFEILNHQDLIFVGDPHDVHSYFSYGQEVISAADGQVVAAVDGFDDQIPGEAPPLIPLEEADGNHVVIDHGNGNFAFYAHLIKGSVTVEEGDFVTRGQLLGLVGNSGNTIAPHLHFHMMAGPSTFGSNGLPYIFDGFELLARSASTEAFDEAEANGTPLEMVPVSNPGTRVNELSLDQSVMIFPGQSK